MNKLILAYNQKKLRYAYLLDKLLNIILFPLTKNIKPYKLKNIKPKKILVIQSHLLGDLVMVTPMLKTLRKTYPDSQIFLLANEFAKDLLEGLPFVDRIITMRFPWAMYDYSMRNIVDVLKVIKQLRDEKFDLAIDGQIDMRNAFLMYLIYAKRRLGYDITGGRYFLTDVPESPKDIINIFEARLSLLNYLGIETSNVIPELPISFEAEAWVKNYLLENNISPEKLVCVHPGASAKERLWNPEGLAKVIHYLKSLDFFPVIIEGPQDNEIIRSITAFLEYRVPIVKASLKKVVSFIKRCKFIICMDSGIVHIAAAVNTPAIALYGPRSPAMTKPLGNNTLTIWMDGFDCRPCEYGHCKNIGHSCMDAISAKAVIQKVDAILTRYQQI